VNVPANSFGPRSGTWRGLWSPELRPIPEEDFANLRVPDHILEEPSTTKQPATEPVTAPPATEPVTAARETARPSMPTVPQAFLDAPRPRADSEAAVPAADQVGEPDGDEDTAGHAPAEAVAEIFPVRSGPSSAVPAATAPVGTGPRHAEVAAEGARQGRAGLHTAGNGGVADGGSGGGSDGGTAVEDRPDPLGELIRREYEEAKAAMAAAAMTVREAEAAAALAGSAGTAGCELSVAHAHMQNTADRFNRAKEFWASVFGT
jgi:hypothetical protein